MQAACSRIQPLRHRIVRGFSKTSASSIEQELPSTKIVPCGFRLSLSEYRVISILLKTARARFPGSEVRICGGWVRDKLLNTNNLNACHDMDVVTDGVPAPVFTASVVKTAKDLRIDVSGYGIIRENTEKSKHREAATTRILDISINFTQFRQECRQDDSTTPDVRTSLPPFFSDQHHLLLA